ncbi:DUF676-domain-containing protein [Calocera cornea HHB12733]|uniref:DUF676-domain-containing protein n=1 Tax=Calocera cornea HHB12733 TaxID=1353952 RepID=A0A165EZ34_9BASI|nr:DUF676-domain-containing protein [Calocera cornea HHB12733]
MATTNSMDDPLITFSLTNPTAPPVTEQSQPAESESEAQARADAPPAAANGHITAQPVHLVLFVHGMWGDPAHLSSMSSRLRRQFPVPSPHVNSGDDEQQQPSSEQEPVLDILVAKANRGNHTYDGVDWGAERVAGEFLEYVDKLEEGGKKKVVKVSIVGYSLGGLIARYVIGILQTQNFFDRVTPSAFYTFAAPHIGLPRYPSFYSSLTYTLGPRWLSRTGEQFYAIDSWGSTGRPLLEIMADPEGVFYRGLERFGRRCLYANAAGDVTVPYVTSAIEVQDPFFHYQTNGIKLTFDTKYPHLIVKWELPSEPPAPPEAPTSILSYEYISSFWPARPVLPPHLQFSYPYNYVFYALSPLLVPLVAPIIVLALVYRFSSAARESRRRIALLESDGPGALSPTLSRRPTLLSLNRSGTLTPTIESGPRSPDGSGTASPVPTGNGKPSAAGSSTSLLKLAAKAAAREREAKADGEADTDGPMPDANALAAAAGEQPMLTDVQRRCAEELNGLGFEKHLVLIEGVRNAHGPLICRASFQKQGADVLDHWAEGFEL